MEDVQADNFEPGIFVRGVYDYSGGDPSALAFTKGAIIEVFTRLDTGWWDGVLGDERGWFPKNYVELLTQEEVDEHFASLSDPVDSGHWDLERQAASVVASQSFERYPQDGSTSNRPGAVDDFWIPQVNPSGQIFYRNSKTGEESRDLPSGVRSGVQNASNLGRPAALGRQTSYDILERNSRTVGSATQLTNWVKRLADDGISVYWYNVDNGEISWTEPNTRITRSRSNSQHVFEYKEDLEDGYQALRRGFSSDIFAQDDAADVLLGRLSVDSDVSSAESLDASFDVDLTPRPVGTNGLSVLSQSALAERNTRDLQSKLAPTSSEALATYSNAAREAIREVTAIGSVPFNGYDPSSPNHAALVMDRVTEVVLAVRNLLYVSGTLASPLSSLMPQTVEAAESVRSPMLELKPLQRKVTATLSKLVLSARANKTNSAWTPSEAGPRIDFDAVELDRAVVTFVTEVEHQTAQSRAKRLQGVLESAEGLGGVGLGNFGGGLGGHSKALGFVPAEDTSERQVLSQNLALEIDALRSRISDSLLTLNEVIRSSSSETQANAHIRERGPVIVTELSTLLSLIEDVDVASDIDVSASQRSAYQYAGTSKEARTLLRQLETSKQAMFDEGMLFLMVCQGVDISEFSSSASQKSLPHVATQISSSLLANMHQTQISIEGLVVIAEKQAEFRRPAPISRFPRDSRGRAREPMVQLQTNGHRSLPSFDIDPNLIAITGSNPSAYIDGLFAGDDPLALSNGRHSTASSMLSIGDALSRPAPGPIVPLTAAQPPVALEAGRASTDTAVPTSVSLSPSASMKTSASTARPATPESDDEFTRLKPATTPVAKKNLKEILGQDAPDLEEPPWYLRPSYKGEDIKFTPDGSVRGGTLEALVENLTTHATRDNTFFDTFIMTFKSFTNLDELFTLLVARFEIRPPDGLTQSEYEDWKLQLQARVRIRVINAMKAMLSEDVIGPSDGAVLARIRDFATRHVNDYGPAKILLDNINTRGNGSVKRIISNAPHAAPQSIVPRIGANRKLKLLNIDPLEFARQLTLKESELFMKIRAMDCLARAKDGQTDDDSIRAIISMSNKLADWVNNAVLSMDDPRKRSWVIKHFILTAERCRSLNNFSTMAALVAALNSPPIRRLKRTWDVVPNRHIAILDDIEKTMQHGKNLAEYRIMLSKVSLPCVPFIGVYLTTLTFIQDGMKDKLVKEGNLINFAKRLKASAIIAEIKRYQSQPYNLSHVPVIRQFIDEALTLEETSDYFWDLSLKLEPREREDEKMARLLQESGFL